VSSFDAGTWETAEAGGGGNHPPREGDFELAIDGARAFTSKNGKDIVVIDVRDVVSGATWGVLGSFASPGAVGMTKELCESLDVDVSAVQSLDELDTRLKEAVGRFYAAEVKLNSDFWNTYFNRRIESDVPAEVSEAVAGAKADDDIPFRWQSAPDHSERRRDLFVGDRWSV
jgi:hypothetical protein